MALYGYNRANPSSENSKMPKAVYMFVWYAMQTWCRRREWILDIRYVYLNTSYAHFFTYECTSCWDGPRMQVCVSLIPCSVYWCCCLVQVYTILIIRYQDALRHMIFICLLCNANNLDRRLILRSYDLMLQLNVAILYIGYGYNNLSVVVIAADMMAPW